MPGTIEQALAHDAKPAVVQAIANLLDSPGGIRRYAEPARPREIIAAAQSQGVGVMGIRAVQAGALTAQFDRTVKDTHPDGADFRAGRAVPRAVRRSSASTPRCSRTGTRSTSPGVDTVVLGVKNRAELAQCLEAEASARCPPTCARGSTASDLRAADLPANLRSEAQKCGFAARSGSGVSS